MHQVHNFPAVSKEFLENCQDAALWLLRGEALSITDQLLEGRSGDTWAESAVRDLLARTGQLTPRLIVLQQAYKSLGKLRRGVAYKDVAPVP